MRYLSVLFFLLPLAASQLEERVERLEERLRYYEETERIVESIERKSFQDRINLSTELRLRMDSFSYKLTKLSTDQTPEVDRDAVEGDPFDKTYDPHYALRLRVNMTAEMGDDMRFFARLVASRSTQNHERLCVLSRAITAEEETISTALDFDRAYVDLLFARTPGTKWYASAGILPTSGGSSSHLIEDTPRKSMFPSLIFDANVMGAILTADLSGVSGIEKSFVRAIGGKALTLNAEQFYYQCNRETIRNMDVAGLFAEGEVPGLAGSLAYIGMNRAGNIKAVPYLGSSSASIDLKTLPALGDVTNLGAGFELRGLGGVLDLFAHGAISDPDGNGKRMDFTGTTGTDLDGDGDYDTLTNASGDPAFTNADYARGTLLEEEGSAYHVGLRYHLSRALNLGAEYNHGSRYWWSVTQGSEDVFNKLATRGSVQEYYLSYRYNRTLDLRLGYLHIHEDYTGSGWHFGEPAEKSGDQRNYYVILRTRF